MRISSDARSTESPTAALVGRLLPDVRFYSTRGDVVLRLIAAQTLVIFVYPRTAVPGGPQPHGWDAVPGAPGCTVECRAFRDREREIRDLGATILGISAQALSEQTDFALREQVSYPLASDPTFALARDLALPTFTVAGTAHYERLTLVARARRVVKVFYPITSPRLHPEQVVEWLRQATQ